MNRLIIIGNLTRDPSIRTLADGTSVCDFDVAVNRRRGAENVADYFRVTAWRALADNCARYLARGRKVCVIGSVTCRAYEKRDGSPGAALEVQADSVEFLSPVGTQSDAIDGGES
ncbi:MAG: single-stranded DNA-binding protein [Candidatus Fimadaptatus sp.]